MKLIGGRGYLRISSTLPGTHPDAWVTQKPDQIAIDTASYMGQAAIGWREVFLFVDVQGRVWAQPMIARSWDEEGVGAPSNRDLEQEAKHRV